MAEGPRERCEASSTSGASLIRDRVVGLAWAAGVWASFLIDRDDCRPAAGGEARRTRTAKRGEPCCIDALGHARRASPR